MVNGVIIRSEDLPWVEVGRGIFRREFQDDRQTGAQFLLFRLEKGARYPEHDHPTGEEFLVLEGSITVDDQVLKTGDYYRTPVGERHFNETESGTVVLVVTPPRKR